MTFDPKRFAQLLETELRANPMQYLGAPLISLAIILGIVLWQILTSTFNYWGGDDLASIEIQISFMGWFGFGIGVCIINAGAMFSNMKTRTLRINTLMLPASTLEKFLVRWILFVPFSILIYYVGLFALDALQYLISWVLLPNSVHYFASWNQIFFGSMPFMYILLITQSIFCLGSSIWPKNSVLHTILWLMALNFVTSTISTLLITLMAESSKVEEFLSMCVIHHVEKSEFNIWIDTIDPLTIAHVILATFTIIVCAVNYTLAYYRFKENEIIDRW